jgi:hypothetical protein
MCFYNATAHPFSNLFVTHANDAKTADLILLRALRGLGVRKFGCDLPKAGR